MYHTFYVKKLVFYKYRSVLLLGLFEILCVSMYRVVNELLFALDAWLLLRQPFSNIANMVFIRKLFVCIGKQPNSVTEIPFASIHRSKGDTVDTLSYQLNRFLIDEQRLQSIRILTICMYNSYK